MRAVNNLPENPGRIYPIRSFVAAATGERSFWYGSTGSPFCHVNTDQSAFMLTVHLHAPTHQLRTSSAIVDSTSCFLSLFCAQDCPFPSLLPNLLWPEAPTSWRRSQLLGSGIALSLCKNSSRGLGSVCISAGDDQTLLPSARIWGFSHGDRHCSDFLHFSYLPYYKNFGCGQTTSCHQTLLLKKETARALALPALRGFQCYIILQLLGKFYFCVILKIFSLLDFFFSWKDTLQT